MTDRVSAFIVVLDEDLRVDDAKATLAAIEQIKGVIKVTPQIRGIADVVAESRARSELQRKLLDVLTQLWD